MRKASFVTFVTLVVSMFIGCAGSKKAVVSPAVGAWEFAVATPDGDYTGTLTILGSPEELSGSFYLNDDGTTTPLENISFVDPNLTFEAPHVQYGRLVVTATLEADAVDGTIAVPGYGDMAIKATRQVESN